MKNVRSLCAMLMCALSPALTAEVQVNIRTSGSQANPAVAASDAGGSIIVWSSYYTTAGRSNDILARRLDAIGAPVCDEFTVNVTTQGNQTVPAIAMDSRGAFAVAWQGPGAEEEDIFLRRFDPNGLPEPGETLVNSGTMGRQLCPSVALNDAGTLGVAWESREIVEDVNRTFVYARLFHPNGPALGDDIVLDASGHDCRYPDVAIDGHAGFAAAWLEERTSNNNVVIARLFDPNGVPTTEPLEVSTAGIASLTRPVIAMNSCGHFVVAWDGDPNRASEDDVYIRPYDPNGAPLGEPSIVNTVRSGPQQWPRVAINDTNEFVIIWEQAAEDPNNATDIFVRQFDGTGQPAGEPVRINAYVPGKQQSPDGALMSDGSFLAAWVSDEQDGSGYGIFAEFVLPVPSNDPNSAI